jgi:uncharacterized membrane protein
MEDEEQKSYEKENGTEQARMKGPKNEGIPPPPTSGPPPKDDNGVHYHYHYPPQSQGYYPPYQLPGRKSGKPRLAGALLITAAILGFIFVPLMGFAGVMFGDLGNSSFFWAGDGNTELQGVVMDDNGEPPANVTVSIVGHNDVSDLTGENGRYFLLGVPTGNQEIKAEKTGYKTTIYKKFVAPDGGEMNWEGSHWNTSEHQDLILVPGTGTVTSGSYPPFEAFQSIIWVCISIIAILSVVTLLGGLYALKRSNWPMALIGSVCGIFTIGFGLGTILAFVALFVLILCRDEFKSKEELQEEKDPSNTV